MRSYTANTAAMIATAIAPKKRVEFFMVVTYLLQSYVYDIHLIHLGFAHYTRSKYLCIDLQDQTGILHATSQTGHKKRTPNTRRRRPASWCPHTQCHGPKKPVCRPPVTHPCS